MLNFLIYSCFFLAALRGFLKAEHIEDIAKVDRNFTEILDEDTFNTEEEIADVYDEYMKISIFDGVQFRSAVENEKRLWENGIVPYVISENYSKENRDFILASMDEFRKNTCVEFRPRKNEVSYVMLVPGSGCSAVIGKIPNNRNRVNLHQNCFVKGIILHELMHALGFIHEQNRPDRDEFVRIIFDNIKKGFERNYKKYSEDEIQLFNQTYDYESVMHYGSHDFAMDKNKPTIIPLGKDVEIGQRKWFSEIDLIKINLLYNCKGQQTSEKATEDKRGVTEDETEKEESSSLTRTQNSTKATEGKIGAKEKEFEKEEIHYFSTRTPKVTLEDEDDDDGDGDEEDDSNERKRRKNMKKIWRYRS